MLPVRQGPTAEDDLDDAFAELPALDGDDTAAADLELGDDVETDRRGEAEEVGLDTSAGVEDEEDELDTLEETSETDWDEVASTSDEGDASSDLETSGNEGGWIEGSEAVESADWDFDLGDLDDGGTSLGDSGEEGVEERVDNLGEDDAAPSTPDVRARGEEELADDLDLEGEGEIDSPDEEMLEHPALALPRLSDQDLEVRWLGPEGEAITALGSGLACGRALHRFAGDALLPAIADDGTWDEDAPESVARDASGAWLVGLRIGGILRSHDEGRTFERLEASRSGEGGRKDDLGVSGPLRILAEPHETGVRLWARTRGGALFRSDDGGASWSRPLLPGAVLAFALADHGVVGVIGGRQGPVRIVRTHDGGRSWRSLGGPPIHRIADDGELYVAALDRDVVISGDVGDSGPYYSHDDGQRWTRLAGLRDAGPIGLVRERGRAILYAGVLCEGIDRGLLVRLALSAPDARPSAVLDLEALKARERLVVLGESEGEQRIYDLQVVREGARTRIDLATGLGVVRVRVGDGAPP